MKSICTVCILPAADNFFHSTGNLKLPSLFVYFIANPHPVTYAPGDRNLACLIFISLHKADAQ